MSRWVHPAWKALEIEPTSDQRAIRVAYSARLKAIDPETDPQAFIALREAFEAAKIQAQWADLPDEDEEDEEDWDEQAWDENASWDPAPAEYVIRPLAHAGGPEWQEPALEDAAPAAEAATDEGPASPWAPIRPADADAHARALATLLYSNDRQAQPYPSDAQTEEMLSHWQVIAADPRMQEIAFFADADRWTSELIARTVPFSDPLVPLATRHFGWTREQGAITQSHAVARVTERYRMLEFLDAVKAKQHPLNEAWRELTRPATERTRRGIANGRRVRQLLRIVRDKYPDMEGCFDTTRVALWDNTAKSGGSNWRWTIAGIIGAILIIRLLGALGSSTNPTSPPILATTELTSPIPDIDHALDATFGDGKLDMATIEKSNRKLHRALLAYWAEEQPRAVGLRGFTTDVNIFLINWYADGVWKGDPALLTDFHTLAIDMAKALRTRDPAACRQFLQHGRLWTDRLKLPESFHERQKALVIRAALTTDGGVAREGGKFSVPGDVMEAAAARAHMNRAALSAAMLFEGSDANQCVGRIAFMETVLALPRKQGLPIMRNM